MASVRQKAKASEQVGMYFLEQGKILTEGEYKLAGHVPVRYHTLKAFYGSWAKVINGIRIHCPELYKELLTVEEEPAPKPVVDPLAELQAATGEALASKVDADITAIETEDESEDR
jgi:hypothetical protein